MIKISNAVLMSLAFFAFGVYAGHLLSSAITPAMDSPLMQEQVLQQQIAEKEQEQNPKQSPEKLPEKSPEQISGQTASIIAMNKLKNAVLNNTENVEAWNNLGNWYFDHNQPGEAIAAYAESLKLRPGDPNVITDQGIMYRSLGKYKEALENFRQANKIAPWHSPSLFNAGIVLLDMKLKPDAIKAWKELQTRDHNFITPQGISITEAIKLLEQE